MPSRAEKQRRRAIVRAIREQEWSEAEACMPISKDDLQHLLDHLEQTVFERLADGRTWAHCDGTLRRTRAFLQSRSLSEEMIVPWLREYGGFCDCEVASNVGDVWANRLNDS